MILSEIKELYDSYISSVRKAQQDMKPSDGLFGIGRKLSDDPCHDDFAEKLERMLSDHAAGSPEPSEVREVLGYIYDIPKEYERNDSVCLMLTAVHGFTTELAAYLSADDAAELLERYKENYPKNKRLPVQKKLIKVLEKAANKT